MATKVKYMPPGGIIEMRIQKNEMHAKITVKDNGAGIEKEKGIRFSKFYKREKNVTTQKVMESKDFIWREKLSAFTWL